MKALRIAIACGGLCAGKGGSERAAVDMAREMAARGHSPLLLGWEGLSRAVSPVFEIPGAIPFLVVRHSGQHDYIEYLKNYLIGEKIDVFLSIQSDFAHLFWQQVCKGSGIPFIYSEQSDPHANLRISKWNHAGRLAALSGADCIHTLLNIHAKDIPENFTDKIRVIPNAAPINALASDPIGGIRKKLLFLARLAPPKRPEILISAFTQIMNDHPDWDLELWGGGPKMKDLLKQVSSQDICLRVKIMGISHNPAEAFAGAQIFCLPSDYEGLPLTALEAMSAGLPVTGFGACRGLAGVVRNGETGLLSDEATPQSLAMALDRLMGDPELRARMGKAAKKECAKYAPDKIYDQWENLFFEMAELKNRTAMDAMSDEKFTNRANLSAAARAEWLYRDFEGAMPWSFAWLKERACNFALNIAGKHGSKGLS